MKLKRLYHPLVVGCSIRHKPRALNHVKQENGRKFLPLLHITWNWLLLLYGSSYQADEGVQFVKEASRDTCKQTLKKSLKKKVQHADSAQFPNSV